ALPRTRLVCSGVPVATSKIVMKLALHSLIAGTDVTTRTVRPSGESHASVTRKPRSIRIVNTTVPLRRSQTNAPDPGKKVTSRLPSAENDAELETASAG